MRMVRNMNQETPTTARSGLENYRRRVSATKRRSILDAGREEFQGNGFTHAAMAEIARKADVSTATLYKHFNSKEELFAAVVAEAYSNLELNADAIADADTIEEALATLADNYLKVQFDQGLNDLMRAVISEVSGLPEVGREFYEMSIKRRHDELSGLFDRLIQRGMLKPHDTSMSAHEVAGMLKESLIWPALFDPSFKLPDNKDKIVSEAVATFVARYGA